MPRLAPVLAEIAARSDRNEGYEAANRGEVLAEIAARSDRNIVGQMVQQLRF